MREIEALKEAMWQHIPGVEVSSDADVLRDYAVDGVLPRLVATPGNVEEVAQIVALTNHQGLSLLTRGGGSRMDIGGVPERIDVLLETKRLTQLLEYEAADLTCHVQAGLTLAALQAHLGSKGQR